MYGSVIAIPAWMERTANPRGPASGAFFCSAERCRGATGQVAV